MKKDEESLGDLWDTTEQINIGIMAVPEGEEREKGGESLFKETVAENFPNLGKEVASRSKNPNGHIIIKLSKVKDKERILKAAREK